jgi:hypothetical protein
LACSLTSQLPTASTHAASITASHALDRQLSKLSSTPTVDFVDTIEFLDAASFTSAAEFPTVPLCHPSIVSSSLGQSSPKPQLSSAYCCVSCCVLPRTVYRFLLLSHELPPRSYYPAMLFVSLYLDGF